MRESEINSQCAMIATLKLFSAKWKPCILAHLLKNEKRYTELLRLIPNITKKMLTEHLRELENDQLIHREVTPTVPPMVTYSITEKGKSLEFIFRHLSDWGVENLDNVVPMDEMLVSAY